MDSQFPANRDDFETRIESGRAALLDYVHSLEPPSLVTDVRDAAGWSVKDHLAHISRWERSIIYLLGKRPRHAGLGVSPEIYQQHDVDQINEEIFRQTREIPFEEILSEFDAVHRDLMTTLGRLRWDDLHLGYAHYAPDEPGDSGGAPVGAWVVGNTYVHYSEHLDWMRQLVASAQRERT